VNPDSSSAEVPALQDRLDRAGQGLADLRAEFSALADPEVQSLDDEHDSEGATIGFERARVAGLIERAERRIADLDDALRRAAEGRYDVCSSCGRRIEADRLEALPATTLCITCAHDHVGR
jgi:DnaK suppressor protein